MIYIATALNFFDKYTNIISGVMIVAYLTYVATNMIFTQYRGHNRAIVSSIAKLRQTATTGKVVPFVASVPLAYRGQWHCYTTAHSVPAVSMFTAVPATNRHRANPLLAVSIVLAVVLGVVTVRFPYNTVAIYSLGIYVLVQWPLHALLCAVRRCQYGRANRLFGRWVSLVQAYFGMGDTATAQQAKPNDIDDMIEQLQLVKRCDKSQIAQKVASILGSQPQNVERTVSQQRRINHVLNDLIVNKN